MTTQPEAGRIRVIALMKAALRWSRQRSRRPFSITSVALIELTRLGDVLSSLPAVATIRDAYPQAAIHLFVRDQYVRLAGGFLDGVTVHSISSRRGLRSAVAALRTIRALAPTLAVSLGPGRLNGIAALLSGARGIAGYLDCKFSLVPFKNVTTIEAMGIDTPVCIREGSDPLAERAMKVCSVLGISEHSARPLVSFRATDVPQELFPTSDAACVAVHPFSAWAPRSWPLRSYEEVCAALLERTSHSIIIFGGPDDVRSLADVRRRFAGNQRVAFVEGLSLETVAGILRRCSLFVGNDSGILHLAAGLGVACVALYGPAEPRLTKPFHTDGANFVSLYHRLECSPCDQITCVRPEMSCMMMISVQSVVDAALDLLHMAARDRVRANA